MSIQFPDHLKPLVANAVKELCQTDERPVAHLPKPWSHFWVDLNPPNDPSVIFKTFTMAELGFKGTRLVYLNCRDLLGGRQNDKR